MPEDTATACGDRSHDRKGVVVPECVTVVPKVSTESPIAVAMSGGVDSSTVAAMLVRDGHTVVDRKSVV